MGKLLAAWDSVCGAWDYAYAETDGGIVAVAIVLGFVALMAFCDLCDGM